MIYIVRGAFIGKHRAS